MKSYSKLNIEVVQLNAKDALTTSGSCCNGMTSDDFHNMVDCYCKTDEGKNDPYCQKFFN